MISRLKITPKLTLVLILFSVALVVAIGLINYFSRRALLQREALQNVSAIAFEKEAALTAWLLNQRDLVATIAAIPEVSKTTALLLDAEPGSDVAQSARDELVKHLVPWRSGTGHLLDLLVIHPVTGIVLAATNPDEEGKFKEQHAFFLEGRKAPYVQTAYYSLELQSVAMTATAPVYGIDGRLIGILAGRLNIGDLNQIIQRRVGFHQSDDAFLVNASSLFVTQPRLFSDPAVLRVGVHSEAARRCLAGESGSMSTEDYRGIPAMIAFRWLPQYNLCLIAKLDQAEALQPLDELLLLIGLISILTLVAASGVAIILARKITGPVHAIQIGAKHFAQGNLKVHLQETGRDEIGSLAREFNQMADSLTEKETRLREYADDLEPKVDERTAALKESEEHYRLLFNQILYGFALHEVICDDDGHPCNYRFLEVNPAFEQLTGLQASSIVGQTVLDVLPNTEPEWIEQFGLVALTGESIQFENYAQDLSKYYEVTAYCPKLGQFAVIFLDVTERKRAAQEMEGQNILLNALIDSPEDIMIFSLHKDYRYTAFNENHRSEMRKVCQAEIDRGISLLDVMTIPDLRAHAKQSIDRVLQGETFSEIQHQADQALYYEFNWSPIRQKDGQVAGITAFIRNITASKRAEAAIRDSEERYRSLFENMLNGYAYCQMIFDNDQPKDFIYLSINNAFQKLTGLKDVEGKKVSEVIPGIQVSNPELMDIYGRVSRTGESEEFENYVEELGIWFSISVYSPMKDTFVSVFENITDRKQAEEALAQLHTQLLRGEQIGHHGSWEWDIQNDRVVWSDGLYQIFGLAPQIFGATYGAFLERVHPDDRVYVRQVIETTFREPGAFEFENRIVLPDGQVRSLFTRGELLLNENGAPARMVGVAMDITERKEIEDALRESQNLLNETQRISKVGGWKYDVATHRVTWTEEVHNIYGVSKDYDPSDPEQDIQFYAPEDQKKIAEAFQRAVEQGEPYDLELQLDNGQGKRLWVRTSGQAERKGDEIIRVFGFMIDITEPKQAEETITRYTERLAVINRLDHVISSSLEIGTVYDAFVGEMKNLIAFDRTAIVLVDDAGENWQILRQWTLGKPTFQPNVWHPVQGTALGWVAQHQQSYLEEILGEQTQWPEHGGLLQEGLQSRVLLPLIIQGKVIGLLTLASRQPKAYQQSDLELLQTLADQLAIAVQNANLYGQARLTAEALEQRVKSRTAQLEKANKDLESFSYSVSHDLRAPLRAINGFAQILMEFHKENLDSEGQHYLNNVVEASSRMGILIDDLLKYSRLGRSSVHRQHISLQDLFARILRDLSPQITETGAVVVLSPAGHMPQILSDPTILSQIFSNVLGNALTYHRPGVPPLIQVRYQADGGYHLFDITDNGIGIPAEYLDKIFNVFQRLHSSEEYPGTGIGLAIVEKSVELLTGRVWAESKEDCGSTFWIKFPKE